MLSDKLVFRPRLTPVAGRDIWHPRPPSDRGRTVRKSGKSRRTQDQGGALRYGEYQIGEV